MVASVRYRAITNTTGAVVAPGDAIISYGQDHAFEAVERTLAAIDVGAEAGKIRHAGGMIFAEFQGSPIKSIISVTVYRPTGDPAVNMVWLGTDAATAAYGVTYSTVNGLNTIRFYDEGGAAAQLAAGDIVVVAVALGNS